MSIVRAPKPEVHFIQIHNDVARDGRLSYRARGLLVRILSNADNFKMTTIQLAEQGQEGRDAVRTAMHELRRFGYAELEKYRKEDGEYDTRTIVFDTPNLNSKDKLFLPKPDFQASVTEAGFSGAGFSGALKKIHAKKNHSACMQKNNFESKNEKSKSSASSKLFNEDGFEVIAGVWCHPNTAGKPQDDFKNVKKMIEVYGAEAVEAAAKQEKAETGRNPYPSYVSTRLTGNQNAKTKPNCNTSFNVVTTDDEYYGYSTQPTEIDLNNN